MKFYITKYVLTQGILEKEGELVDSISGKKFLSCKGKYCNEYFHGNDFHDTKEKAMIRADIMLTSKIASLQKQIEKLEKLKFGN
jgi:hypothetical protein